MLMQPSPRADTVRPEFPNARVCIEPTSLNKDELDLLCFFGTSTPERDSTPRRAPEDHLCPVFASAYCFYSCAITNPHFTVSVPPQVPPCETRQSFFRSRRFSKAAVTCFAGELSSFAWQAGPGLDTLNQDGFRH